jgi:hypothetical protein
MNKILNWIKVSVLMMAREILGAIEIIVMGAIKVVKTVVLGTIKLVANLIGCPIK